MGKVGLLVAALGVAALVVQWEIWSGSGVWSLVGYFILNTDRKDYSAFKLLTKMFKCFYLDKKI